MEWMIFSFCLSVPVILIVLWGVSRYLRSTSR
jgi:hypothetical protein